MKKLVWLIGAACAVAGYGVTIPKFVAHRGESIDAPENTVAAYTLAAERGVNGIECDVYMSSDGIPICLHDNTFTRTCGNDAKPADLTWAQISQLNAAHDAKWASTPYANATVPSLAQYLQVIAANNVFAFIEIKSGSGVVAGTVNAVRNAPGLDLAKVQFISFSADHIRALRQTIPECKAHLLVGNSGFTTAQALIQTLAACNASGVDIEYQAAFTAEDVATVKAAGYDFHVWTVDNVASAAELAVKGVDSITTNKGKYLRDNIEAEIAKIEAAAAAAAALLNPMQGSRETLVIAPGNGVATNVTDKITGNINVQINDGADKGGMVTLSALNEYTGCTYVKSGKLSVSSVSPVITPSAIGAIPTRENAVIIGNGTFNFTGAYGTTDRDFIFMPHASFISYPGIIDVAEGGNLRVTGRVTGFNNGNASFAKLGKGTFTIATKQGGVINEFKQNRGTHYNQVQIPANGDSIAIGVSCFNIFEGRVVVDTANNVTNKFGNEALVGAINPAVGGAHMDIKGGVNIFNDWLAIARSSGNASTNPDKDFCSVNVSGGTVTMNSLGLAYQQNNNTTAYNSLGIMNVSGGSVNVAYNVRLDHTKSRGIINVSGGVFKTRIFYVAHYNGGDTQFTLNQTGGEFECWENFDTAEAGASTVRFNLTGGKFKCATLKNSKTTDAVINADGAEMVMNGNWQATKMVVGSASLEASGGSRTLNIDVEGADDNAVLSVTGATGSNYLIFGKKVQAATDVAVGSGISFGGNNVTKPVTLGENARLRLTAATTLPDLRMGSVAAVEFNQASAKLTLGAWQAPQQMLKVTLTDASAVGSKDLITYPSSVNFDASKAMVVNAANGKAYAFSVREDGATRTLVVTTSNDSGASATPVGYTTKYYAFSDFPSATITGPITITGDRTKMMGVDVPAGETLTFAGGVDQQKGGFSKLGAGTLKLTGPHYYGFSKDLAQSYWLNDASIDFTRYDENGNWLKTFNAFEVVTGILVFGAPGQSFSVGCNEMWVGSGTKKTGVENSAAVIQNGGDARVTASFLVVGRNPGYWKNASENTLGGREYFDCSYTLNGGLLEVHRFILGYDNGCGAPQMSKFEMFGGTFRQTANVDNGFRIGGNANHEDKSQSHFIMHGGTAEVEAAAAFPHFGNRRAFLSLSEGAQMTFKRGITFNQNTGRDCSVAIIDSALRFSGSLKGGSKIALTLDGATLAPMANTSDVELQEFGTFVYGNGGLTIDTADMTAGWFNIRHALRGEGVLRVRGDDTYRAVCLRNPGGSGHAVPVVVERGGAVSVEANASANCTFTILDGGAIWNTGLSTGPNTVQSLTFGEDADSITYLRGSEYGNNVAYGISAGSLTVNGKVRVAYRQIGSTSLSTAFSGRKQVLTAPRGTLNAAQFELDPEVAEAGMTGTFEVTQNENGTDTLWIDASGSTSHSHVWTAGDGAWADAANWANGAVPENVAGDPVSFPAGLAGNVRVNMNGAECMMGSIVSQSKKDVAIENGVLCIDNGAGSALVASTGGGAMSVPGITRKKDATSEGIKVQGRVSIDGPLTKVARVTADNNAILSGAPQFLSQSPISMGNAWLRPTVSGEISSRVTAEGDGLFIDVPEDVTVSMSNINNGKAFVKIGRGTLTFTQSGSFFLGTAGIGDINVTDFMFPTNGTTPTTGCPSVGIFGGRVVLGRDGQTITVNNNEFWVGGHPVMEPDGTTADAQLDVMGGKLIVNNYFGVGRTRNDRPTNNEWLTRRPNYTFNLYDGEVDVAQFLMNYCNQCKLCANSTVNIYGGKFRSRARFAIPNHRSTVTINGEGNVATFNQFGGEVYVTGTEHVKISGYTADGGEGVLNLYGGVFDTKNVEVRSHPYAGQDYGIIRIAGGTLKTKRLQKSGGSGTATLVLNGGAFVPTSDAALSGFDVCVASTNATAIDVSQVASHTLDQVVAHDAELGAVKDGGLVKRGYGRLLVKKAMTMTGPLEVHGGAVDLNGQTNYALAGLAGSGAVTNGSVVVSDVVEPKADGAAYGFGMSLNVDAFRFASGAKWKINVIDAEAGQADRLEVKGALTAAGAVTVDFGRSDDDPLPIDFNARVGSVGAGTQMPKFACVNTGLPRSRDMTISRIGNNLYARAIASGTQIILR